MRDQKRTQERGIALILVLGVLAILVVMALEFAITMRLEEKIAHNYLLTEQAGFKSEAGIEDAIVRLRADYTLSAGGWYDTENTFRNLAYDHLDEDWARGELVQFLDGVDTMLYNTRYTLVDANGEKEGLAGYQTTPGDGQFVLGVQDEQGKINLNTAWAGPLENLILQVAPGFVDAADLADTLELTDNPNTRYYTIQQAYAVGAGEITDSVFFGGDNGAGGGIRNDHRRSGGEPNLDAGLEDFVTVSSECVSQDVPTNSFGLTHTTVNGVTNATAPVNINTASWTTLVAIFDAVDDADVVGEEITLTEAQNLASAVIGYRTGIDENTNIHGDGNDDPFDGFYEGTNTGNHHVVVTLPNFGVDGIDNDGNGLIDDASDNNLYAGGARGEFEVFLDRAEVLGTIGSGDANLLKTHLSYVHMRDFNEDGVIDNADRQNESVPICFSSNVFSITSKGQVVRSDGRPIATIKRRRVIQRNAP